METFSITNDYFGRPEEVELIPGGKDIDVTNENKEYYVERKAYFHLYKNIQKQMDAFLEGFYELIPRDLISVFTYKELELLISGMPDYKIADLKASANYNGYSATSPQIIWFWEVMDTLDRAEKGNFLQFVTGSSKVPIEGFDYL
jgi:E3 ubiquitin-protein ligase HUWE1